MAIKRFKTRQQLGKLLKSRHLEFDDDNLNAKLKRINYFNLFNGAEDVFLASRSPKDYKKTSLDDFLSLYSFDKKFTSVLSDCLDSVEEALKASIAYNFAKKHCVSLSDTMQYTNKENYMDPSNSIAGTPTYCRFSLSYPFKSSQNQKIFSGFSNFSLFRPEYLTKLFEKFDHLDPSFYRDASYLAPPGVAVYGTGGSVPGSDPHVAVPFWVAIETIPFGTTLMLLHYLQDDVMEDVLLDFGLPLNKRSEFLNMIDILVSLRNHCAHTTIIGRYRSEKKYHISNALVTVFGLSPKNTSPASVLSLYDAIKILSFFTDVSRLRKPILAYAIRNYLKKGMRAGAINKKVFSRMGEERLLEWLRMLREKTYIF